MGLMWEDGLRYRDESRDPEWKPGSSPAMEQLLLFHKTVGFGIKNYCMRGTKWITTWSN